MKDIEKKYSIEFGLDLPIHIDGLTLYPFLLKDMIAYYATSRLIKMEKAQVNPIYIKMSYYSFLCHYITKLSKSQDEQERVLSNEYIILFSSLFSLAMRKNIVSSFYYNEETKEAKIKLYELDTENYKDDLSPYQQATKTYELSKDKFDEIRNILIYQNDTHYINFEDYSRDVQNLLKQEMEKRGGKEKTTLEDKIDSVIAATGWTTEDIAKLTIRRFDRIFERVRKKLEYQIYKTGAMSGFVSFKDKSILEPWTNSIDYDPLKNIMSDYDSTMESMKRGLGS